MQDGKTALMLSIQAKSDTVATALVEKGADMSVAYKVHFYVLPM
jgi:hypothetical protein